MTLKPISEWTEVETTEQWERLMNGIEDWRRGSRSIPIPNFIDLLTFVCQCQECGRLLAKQTFKCARCSAKAFERIGMNHYMGGRGVHIPSSRYMENDRAILHYYEAATAYQVDLRSPIDCLRSSIVYVEGGEDGD